MPTIVSSGVPIHYETMGTGRPLVLVHGFASSLNGNWVATGWTKFLSDLGRQVIGLDCRGHGESGKPHAPQAYTGSAMPDDVLAVMDALNIQVADIMGYSMGGWITLNLLGRHPQRFSAAVVGGAGLRTAAIDPRRRNAIAEALEATDESTITDPTAARFRRFAIASGGNDLQALAAVQRSERAQGDETKLREVQAPVLVAIGDKDEALEHAKHLADVLPNAQLALLPGEDHLSAVRAQSYRDAVGAFLGRVVPAVA